MSKPQKQLFSIAAGDLDEIARGGRADLEALRGKRLFLTGGTGFFGKWLLAGLLRANAAMELGLQLTALSRNPSGFIRKHPEIAEISGLTFLAGNVSYFPMPAGDFHFIIHAAADTTAFTRDADERERSRAIVQGTQNMLELAERGSARLLFVSSGAVYGAATGNRDGASEEDYDAARPLIPYGLAKRQAEALCAESSVDCVIARAFAFLGPHLPLDAHFAAGNFLRDALRGRPIEVRGDGTALRSYLYPTDLVIWLLRLLARAPGGRAYNVGSDEVVSTAELARLVAAAVEPRAEVVVQHAQPQGPQNVYLPNIARTRAELGLEVSVPLREAIARTLAFWRAAASR